MKDAADIRHTAHLALLIAQTVLTVVLVAEDLLLEWELWMIPVLLAALVGTWGLMLLDTLPGDSATTVYSAVLMLETFYYGVHSVSPFRIAPVAIVAVMLYAMTMRRRLVWNGIAVGYATTLFRLGEDIFGGRFDFGFENVFITIAHLALLAFAGFVCLRFVTLFTECRSSAQRQQAQLAEEREKVNVFLTNVSHEIRTPVNAVIGMSRLMEKRELPDALRNDVRMVRDAGLSIADELENILDYTEASMGRLHLAHEPYMLSSLVNDLLSEVRPALRNGLELVLDVDPAIPSVMVGDPQKLRKLMRHLIENALKFTESGGVYVYLHAMPRPYGVNLCLRVSDTGPGIDDEVRAHISDRFYKKHAGRARSTGGLGLGLPVVNGFVRLMNGFFRIENDGQDGATVVVSVPQEISDPTPCMRVANREAVRAAACLDLGRIEHPRMRAAWQQALRHASEGLGVPLKDLGEADVLDADVTHLLMDAQSYARHRDAAEALTRRGVVVVLADDGFVLPQHSHAHIARKPFCTFHAVNLMNALEEADTPEAGEAVRYPEVRALLVDDEPTNLIIAEGLLREYGMRVDTADSGAEAIRRYEDTLCDLVFMDHMMPGMDGVEAARQLRRIAREKGRRLAIVALTANTVSDARELFSREGFDGFVAKPIDEQELARVLRRLLPTARIEAVPGGRDVDDMAGRSAAFGRQALPDALRALGVDPDTGLHYCGGDGDLYAEVLRQFAASGEAREPMLEDLIAREDWTRYAVEVHAVKSTAKAIGADAVSAEAARLEAAAKAGEVGVILERHSAFAAEYAALARAIGGALPAMSSKGAGDAPEAAELPTLLKALEASLEEYDADGAMEALAALEAGADSDDGPTGAALREALHAIRRQVDAFDFKQAAADARKARAALEGGTLA